MNARKLPKPDHTLVIDCDAMRVIYTQAQARMTVAGQDRGAMAIRFLLSKDPRSMKLGNCLLLAAHAMKDEAGAECMGRCVAFVDHLTSHQLSLWGGEAEEAARQFDRDPRQSIRLIIEDFSQECLVGATRAILMPFNQGKEGKLRLEKSLEVFQTINPVVLGYGGDQLLVGQYFNCLINSVVFSSQFAGAMFDILKERAGLPSTADLSAITG